jgi:siroheme synthase-like protein
MFPVRFAYPLMLDVSDRPIVIIGGGSVAKRKITGLLEAGAAGKRIRVVAMTFDPNLPRSVEKITAPYQPQHLDGAQLVFATTDSPEVNEQIVRDARARGIFVNRSDEGESAGDFSTPALHRQGEVIVTVSAGSAALAAAIRDRLSTHVDRRYVKMADAMLDLRPAIRDSGLAAHRRQAIFRDLAGDEAIAALHAGGVEQLRRWLVVRYPELKLTP